MRAWNWDRIAAGTGIAAVILLVIASATVGEAPKVDDPASEIVQYYGGDRGKLVTGGILFALGAVLLAWFVSAVGAAVLETGQTRLAATAFGGGLLTVSGIFVLLMTNTAAILVAQEGGDQAGLQALHQLTWTGEVVVSWPIAILVGATAAAALRSGIFPPWYGWTGSIATLLLFLGGTTWAQDGFWAPDGAYSTITFLIFLLWTLVTSWLLVRRTSVAELPPGATTGT